MEEKCIGCDNMTNGSIGVFWRAKDKIAPRVVPYCGECDDPILRLKPTPAGCCHPSLLAGIVAP